ncbi:unnamed protein product [Scytosiphon promiscuus]
MDSSPKNLLRRLHGRDTEIHVLLQRADVLNNVPGLAASDHGKQLLLSRHMEETGSYAALKGKLVSMCECQEQAERILEKAVLLQPSSPSSVASTSDAYTKALSSLLSAPSSINAVPEDAAGAPPPNPTTRLQLQQLRSPPSAQAGGRNSGDVLAPVLGREGSTTRSVSGGGGSSGSNSSSSSSIVTYRMFLEHLGRSESGGFVKAIRLFLFSILGNGGSVNPAAGRPQAAANRDIRQETEDVEVYGSSFLVQRCAEFFLAMQNAMGVHPSWAELGYDSLLACREHLERFVMSKIHPLAFGGKLNGVVDASISARLRKLQFLTPHDLNVGSYARDETVLNLAQEELRKMGSGRCPGDMVTRVVRCCDTIFALLDQGRRFMRSEAGESASPPRRNNGWRPDLDPAGTADDFLPVLIYVVLRARVPRLHSMCEYVQAYHSPVALMSRPGYCFVALRSAVEFLMTLNGATVGMSEHEFRRRALAMSTTPEVVDAQATWVEAGP